MAHTCFVFSNHEVQPNSEFTGLIWQAVCAQALSPASKVTLLLVGRDLEEDQPFAGQIAKLIASLKDPSTLRCERLAVEAKNHTVFGGEGFLHASRAVYQWLDEHHVDIAVFDSRGALGFVSTQAKRLALGLHDTSIAVIVEEPAVMVRERNQEWSQTPISDAKQAWCESYCARHADSVVFASNGVRDWAQRAGWQVTEKKVVSLEETMQNAPEADASRRRSQGVMSSSSPSGPLVSICVPYFNQGKYLPSLLRVLTAVRYEPLEVIVVNDGSTDPVANQVFDQSAELYADRGWRFLRQENAGEGAARNHAAGQARGEYFFFIDADDLLDLDLLTDMVRAIRHCDVDCVTCYARAFIGEDAGVNVEPVFEYTPIGQCLEVGMLENVFGGSLLMVKRRVFEAVGGFRSERLQEKDWEFYARLGFAGFSQEVLPKSSFFYRTHNEQMTAGSTRYARHRLTTDTYTAQLPSSLRAVFSTVLLPLREGLLRAQDTWARLQHVTSERDLLARSREQLEEQNAQFSRELKVLWTRLSVATSERDALHYRLNTQLTQAQNNLHEARAKNEILSAQVEAMNERLSSRTVRFVHYLNSRARAAGVEPKFLANIIFGRKAK